MADLLAIVLAAGEGTRMRSAAPKVLHEVGGAPIIAHVLRAAMGAGASEIALVTGPGHEAVREVAAGLSHTISFFEQTERRGTGHAASMARPLWEKATGYVAVVYGDHPLLRAENFAGVLAQLDKGMDGAVLGFEPKDPTGYGRLITQREWLTAIREHKDATKTELQIGLCNACILTFRAEVFRGLIDKLKPNNAQGELYVTDLVELASKAGHRIGYSIAPERDVLGVNDRAQLAKAEAQFQDLRREDFMKAGVTLRDPATVYFSWDTAIGRDVVIEPSVWLGPGVTIGDGSKIFAFSHIEQATIGPGVTVGPFARIRGGAVLDKDVHLGNFVEVKKSHLGEGTKAGHLSYLGDAEIGARVNIGAGTITSNYDGANKSTTVIGDGAFIGSHNSLVAPVTIGAGAYTGSGSTITSDVEPGALAVARARQENKAGGAAKVRERSLALKKSKQGA